MKDFNPRLRTLSSKAVISLVSLSLIGGSSIAEEPTPNTYTDVSVPQLTDWNKSNVLTVDGVTGATALISKSYIYESVAAKVAAEGDGEDYVGSPASVYWELDNGSGRAPGIQVVTDDLDFPVNNCIMASGEIESTEFPGTIVPKSCTDGAGSSKRYFLEMTDSDVPVDMVFDLGVKDIRYKGVKDPATDEGAALAEFRDTFGIGRIYRVVQKIINNTDERIVGYKFELGSGIGDSFVPLTFEEHGVAFEMRTLVPREFFDGETGAPDIEVWNPLSFATISPKMFDDGSRARFNPGFLDHATAGFLPPQVPAGGVEKTQVIDSGQTIVNGIIGSLTANYFDIPGNQGITQTNNPLPGNLFGYQLPDLLIPTVIGEYTTNDVGGESDAIVAIWDGTNWRSGRAGLDGNPGVDELDSATADNFGIIPLDQLQQWAAKPLGLDIPGEDPADLVRYESILSDDLSGLNTDFFIYIGDKLLDETGALKLSSITLRATANSVTAVVGSAAGDEEPEWMKPGQEPPTLANYMQATGAPVAINDIATLVQDDPSPTITIDVLGNDLIDGEPVLPADGAITIKTDPADGTATIVGGPGNEQIEYTPDADFVGTDTISYTYTLTAGAVESNTATIRIVVDAAPIPDQPVAGNDSATTFKDTAVTINVLANDELNNDEPDTVVVSITNGALNGVASVEDDNTIVYTPGTSFVGFERFTYSVTVDGVVSNTALITIKVDEPYVEPTVTGQVTATATIDVGGAIALSVTDADLSGTTTVTVVNDTSGESEVITLTETGAGTGIFEGTLATKEDATTGTNNDATLHVEGGEQLTTTYADVANELGQAANATATTQVTVPVVTTVTGQMTVTPTVDADESVTIKVTDADLSGTTMVTVVNNTSGESEVVTLTETGTGTGIFEGTLATKEDATTGTNNDGTLHVEVGDKLTSIYTDAANALGQPATVTLTTTVTTSGGGGSIGFIILSLLLGLTGIRRLKPRHRADMK